MRIRLKRRFRLRDMDLWGFDSFAGLPALDDPRDNIWYKGQFACSEEEFRRIMMRKGIRPSEYQLVKGYYDQSLNEELHSRLEGRSAAVVYVDCDLYTSAAQVLRFVKRYLTPGSILCFDEYWAYRGSPHQGEQRAIREFTAANADITLIPWLDYAALGKSFIVQSEASDSAPDQAA